MKKRTATILVILMIITGLSLLLYPTVSDYLKTLAYRRTISDYISNVEPMDDRRSAELLDAARAYNEQLVSRGGFRVSLPEAQREEYYSLLNIDNTGIIGYVSVPKVDISLPLYHGTEERVLQSGVGHLEGSSLPVGGPSTHAVLSTHTGLPSAKLFTNIDQLVAGDTFSVRVLKETLTYEVDQILVVLPHETDALKIEPGKDYCTLMTCTPYGVNSHRLLVRGHRVPTIAGEDASSNLVEKFLGLNNGRLFGLNAELGFLLLFVLLTAAVVSVMLLRRRKRTKRPEQQEKAGETPPEP